MKRYAKMRYRMAQILMVADDTGNVARQLSTRMPPQQFHQCMVVLGHQQRNFLALLHQTDAPIHAIALSHVAGEIVRQAVELRRQLR